MIRRAAVWLLSYVPGMAGFSHEVNMLARTRMIFEHPTWWRDPTKVKDRRTLRVLRNVEATHASDSRMVRRDITDADLIMNGLVMTMNVILLEKHTDIFSMGHAMAGPVSVDQYQKTLQSQVLRFNTRMTPSTDSWRGPQSSPLMARLTYAEIEAVVDDLADELRAHAQMVGTRNNKLLAPYLPIMSAGLVVDPNNFESYLTFNSRFALADP